MYTNFVQRIKGYKEPHLYAISIQKRTILSLDLYSQVDQTSHSKQEGIAVENVFTFKERNCVSTIDAPSALMNIEGFGIHWLS